VEEEKALGYFRLWFVEPIEKLKELPSGAGGFIAFMVGLALYERLIVAKLKVENNSTAELFVQQAMADDLKLTNQQQRIFWDMLRNGLLHQAMPKAGKTCCFFHHTFTGYPEFKMQNEALIICIDPWKFTDRVLGDFISNPSLIIASGSYPLASIVPIPFEKLR
jgi:hypothetical protein